MARRVILWPLLSGCTVATVVLLAALIPDARASEGAQTNAVLSRLETALADVKTVRTHFVQEKRLALFKNALITRGVIQVENPDKLLWRVESPIKYALLIDGKVAKQWDGETGKTQKIPLNNNPVFSAVTEQLRAWFGGRYSLLAKDYEILQRSVTPVVFVFTPKPETPPAKMLKAVTVTFRDDKRYITAIQIDEMGGDVTVLKFEETEINMPLTPKDWEL
jgi:outer membrane lipoprotein-sorting protein